MTSNETVTPHKPKTSHRSQYSLVLGLSSLNGTFEKKSLVLPFYPDVLRLGRQTSSKTQPAPDNGFFDSRVLSRAHAEVWADYDTGHVWIKDSKSSNGTYVNSLRLGDEKSESEPHQLRKNDIIELGIDISNDEGTSFIHRKISAKVDRISFMNLQAAPAGQRPQQFQLQNKQDQNSYGNGTLSRNQRIANGGFRPQRAITESLDMALFGDMDASLKDLSLANSRSTVNGIFMNSGVASSATLELIVKSLIAQIHAAKIESAKIHSVSKLLDDISANQQESRLLSERLPALDEFKQQIATLESELGSVKQEIHDKDRHIYELERMLAKANAEPEVRPKSPDAIDRHGSPISPVKKAREIEELQTVWKEQEPEKCSEDYEEEDDVKDKMEDGKEEEVEEEEVQEEAKEKAEEIQEDALPKTPDVDKLHSVLAELEETKCQLLLFQKRVEVAEALAIQRSKQIGELSATNDQLDFHEVNGPIDVQTETVKKVNKMAQVMPMASAVMFLGVGLSFFFNYLNSGQSH